jgi:hypothetical protein
MHITLEAVYTLNANSSRKSDAADLSGCYLALSEDVLYIVDKQEDMLMRAFYVSQIEVNAGVEDSALLVVTLNRDKEERNEDVAMDRLVDYVLQTSMVKNKTKLGSQF